MKLQWVITILVLCCVSVLGQGYSSPPSGGGSNNNPEMERIAAMISTRQKERNHSFSQVKQHYIYTTEAEGITNLPIAELVHKLQGRTLSATDVLKAYVARAILVTENFNCISEFVPHALERAQELDKLKGIKGPLHGLPICVKDDHDIAGMDTTLGLGKNLNKPANINSVLVQAFIDLGAVIFCKTNIPQTLFTYASDNPIYGEALNHRNPNLAPGGSSAGTACLVGAGGAVFGTGTDIAGSIRIPAHFSGLCTIKPTQNRLSDKGILPTLPKIVGFRGIPGILAQEVETVVHAFRSLTANNLQNKYDPRAVPIPWNDKEFKSTKRLRIGYYTSLSYFPAIGDTIETVLNAKKGLESLRHIVVPFKIENDWEIMKLMMDVVAVDYGHHSHLNELFSNEPTARGVEGLRASCGRPDWQRRLDFYMNPISMAEDPGYSPRISVLALAGVDQDKDIDVWEMMYQRNELISKILSQMEFLDLDLLLAPAFPIPASTLNATGMLFGAVEYTMLWNFVDFPAGIIPYGVESGKNIESYDDQGDSLLRLAKESTRQSVGSPIGVQLIGKPFKEETVLRIMRELETTSDLKFK